MEISGSRTWELLEISGREWDSMPVGGTQWESTQLLGRFRGSDKGSFHGDVQFLEFVEAGCFHCVDEAVLVFSVGGGRGGKGNL